MADNKHGNREGLGAAGFTVADGRYKALPSDFCIVGGSGPNDRTAEQLLKLYPDDSANHRRARGIILGARDRLRVANPPPAAFVAACRNGLTQDVGTADLREDKNGRRWVVVVVGRQRVQARRILDAEGAKRKPPAAPLSIFCIMSSFVGKDFDAELAALEANCRSNCFVAEPPSTIADKARMLSEKGVADGDIALTIGALAAHVPYLIALSKCEEAVQRAVDAGKVPLADCVRLSKLPAAEQVRLMDRKSAGRGRAAKDAAAAPRAKMMPAPRVVGLGKWLAASSDTWTGAEVGALLRRLAGDATALDGFARMRARLESAETMRNGGA
jgi:ParB family chromosome partitioning protein